MKFEKITDEKIKIIFNIEDMKSHNISSQTILDSSTFSQELLQTMLTKAEEEVGFFSYGIKTIDEEGNENTLFVEGCGYGEKNKVIVFPQKVEVCK